MEVGGLVDVRATESGDERAIEELPQEKDFRQWRNSPQVSGDSSKIVWSRQKGRDSFKGAADT